MKVDKISYINQKLKTRFEILDCADRLTNWMTFKPYLNSSFLFFKVRNAESFDIYQEALNKLVKIGYQTLELSLSDAKEPVFVLFGWDKSFKVEIIKDLNLNELNYENELKYYMGCSYRTRDYSSKFPKEYPLFNHFTQLKSVKKLRVVQQKERQKQLKGFIKREEHVFNELKTSTCKLEPDFYYLYLDLTEKVNWVEPLLKNLDFNYDVLTFDDLRYAKKGTIKTYLMYPDRLKEGRKFVIKEDVVAYLNSINPDYTGLVKTFERLKATPIIVE